MENDKLPIRMFQKRKEIDERQTEGGGNDVPPSWVLQGEELGLHSRQLASKLAVVEKKAADKLKKYKNVPIVLKANIVQEALAKSHRSEITELLVNKQPDKAFGINDDNDLLVRIDDTDELRRMEVKLDSFKDNAKAISAIKSIEAYSANYIKETEAFPIRNGKYVVKVKLFNFNDDKVNKRAQDIFLNLLKTNLHLHYEKMLNYSESLTVYEVTADSLEDIESIADFNAIQSIEPMPMYGVSEDGFFGDLGLEFPIPEEGKDYPTVGILDSGIAPIFELRPWIIGTHSSVPENYVNRSHGTFVGGIVAFGDKLEGQSYTSVDGCYLFDATVIPDRTKDKITELDLVANVKEAVTSNKHIKVWNMSLGSEFEANGFSDLGIGLDSLQEDEEILIIKSVGNCNNFESNLPVSRIARGAESIRSLTVGSIAHAQKYGDLAKINNHSPFSRVGPGPSFIIKPEVVHYGGNSAVKDGKAVPNGVKSFGPDGSCRENIGTSFSTPRVSAIAASLNNNLAEKFDPLLLKALIMHSAKYPSNVDIKNIDEKVNKIGFGLPANANDILYNDPYEITLILRESLTKGEFIEILDFPYPDSLIDSSGNYTGQISLTVVNSPILASGQGSEYCQSNIDVKFGTYDEKVLRDTSKKTVINQLGKSGSKNLMTTQIYSKKISPEMAGFANSEKVLIQYGNKFHPNRKYVVNLTEMTGKNKLKFIKAPKKWFLKIEGLYRSFIELEAAKTGQILKQEFCVLLTIKDPTRRVDVYNDVTELLDAANFLHRGIRIKQAIDVRVNI